MFSRPSVADFVDLARARERYPFEHEGSAGLLWMAQTHLNTQKIESTLLHAQVVDTHGAPHTIALLRVGKHFWTMRFHKGETIAQALDADAPHQAPWKVLVAAPLSQDVYLGDEVKQVSPPTACALRDGLVEEVAYAQGCSMSHPLDSATPHISAPSLRRRI